MINIFEGCFWKYSFFIENNISKILFPSCYLEIDFRSRFARDQAPVITLWILCWHWSIAISYKEDAIPEYSFDKF